MASVQPTERLRWRVLYREAELYKAAVRLYTKPLFDWRKATCCSADGKTLYDFARHGLKNLHAVHRALASERFRFRPGLAARRNFNGKRRTLFIFPWEERLVSLLLYRLLNRALDPAFSRSSYAYRWCGFGVDRCQREIIRAIRTLDKPIFVMTRDISNFFDSIDHDILLGKLAQIVEPSDYLFRLLADCVRFRYVDEGEEATALRGVPFGTAIACLFANVYLMELDRRLEMLPGLRFFRYADDLLVLSSSAEAVGEAGCIFQREMAALKLASKSSRHRDFALVGAERSGPCRSEPAIPACSRFRHLGLEFRADGSVGLSRDKFRKICNLFRYAFRRHRRRFRRTRDPEKRARLAVQIARRTAERGVRNVAIIDYYLKHVTDESQLRRLDRWLAEEVLSLAFGGGHKKGYFRRLPFGKLREMGLPSLVHRRRLILHGHVDSPFFVWRARQIQRGYRGKAARPVAPEATAFSQGPEAAADATS